MTKFPKSFVTLGMFIIDEFKFLDEDGQPLNRSMRAQIGGGGTYAALGARIWLPPEQVGMIIDRGNDFDSEIQHTLNTFGESMWHFRDHCDRQTTRAVNSYRGETRGFEYLTPRIRIQTNDLEDTDLANAKCLHFICSPTRAQEIMDGVMKRDGWSPITIYEPIPDRCVPEELPALQKVLPKISVLSPNAEEAISLLSIPLPVTEAKIETAAAAFLEHCNAVVIRCGAMGAFSQRKLEKGEWFNAFWAERVAGRVVDVTGAGNCFLGGLAAGLLLTKGDLHQAVTYGTISASFAIEQNGLPILTSAGNGISQEEWNHERPLRRLHAYKERHNVFT